MFWNLTKKQVFILFGLIFFALIICGIGTGIYIHDKDFGKIGAAVTNSIECSKVAKQIVAKGGSLVDAGIATALCEGVAMSQSMGLGGGFFATIYKKSEGRVYTLDARETAPQASTKDMFKNRSQASKIGGLAVAVPGDIRGYQYLHAKFGVLSWRELFQPSIALCRSGLTVTPYLESVYIKQQQMLLQTPGFGDFINPKTGKPFKAGDKVKRLKLAETLETVASEPDALHQGSLTKGFVQDIAELGGILTEHDMNNYRPVWREPIVFPLSNRLTIHTFPPPGSGAIMGFILSLLDSNMELQNMDVPMNWQRVIESFKFAYGMRTRLGDPTFVPETLDIVHNLTTPELIAAIRSQIKDDYTSQDPRYYGANTSIPEDHGTAHINILTQNGDAIALTGTINLIFGAKVVSKTTGIILNDEMDDFSTEDKTLLGLPSSSANYIAPGKRPLSSMCPSIVLDHAGNVRMLVGAAGGMRITTSSALVALRHLWFDDAIDRAIAAARMHHQLFPMEVSYDPQFNEDLIASLHSIGHVTTSTKPDGFGAVTSLTNHSGSINGAFDPRRGGSFVTF